MTGKPFWQINDGRIWSAEHAQFVPFPAEGATVTMLYSDGVHAGEDYLRETIRFYGYELGELKDATDKRKEILAELDKLDIQCIRPSRAVALGVHTKVDTDKLAAIEARANALRGQLARL